MNGFETTVSRRAVLKGSGALIVSVVAPQALSQPSAGTGDRAFWRQLSPAQLDTYLSIDEQGVVTAYFG